MNRLVSLITLFLAVDVTCAFVVPSRTTSVAFALKASSGKMDAASLEEQANEKGIDIERGRNPDKPELPELKGDFDWDEKFAGDADWITENIPGKTVMGEIELAQQVTALTKMEDKWRKERSFEEYDVERMLGWTERAEMYNGRFAMFFLVTGLLTELWTGYSFPEQVEEMLRITGVIGFNE
jgi:hypothetical protein